ncbi:protein DETOXIFICATION 48-like [Asparagus officinalis]|uniref:protein DETOXIFICATION 48-like n=1 Tax=Asparagus officinalis TaxID=4686 RepID=UPI00098E067D|nr:protein DETOXIFICATION 48-like [Asparagus officinalis]
MYVILNSNMFTQIMREILALSRISIPTIATGLLIYIRNLVSMVFLGHLGHIALAAGSLSTGVANITGYSIIFGMAMGMETICGQAYGAGKWNLLGLTLHRTIAILLLTSLPISLLWLNVDKILVKLGQDIDIINLAKIYLLYSLPDLIAQSIVHPLRIYLRSQNVTRPVAICSCIASLLHIPLNYYLVIVLNTGIKGVAAAVVITNFILVLILVCYIYVRGLCSKTRIKLSLECFKEWESIFSLAVPSCISICLEWWWYELLIILCGLLKSPEITISAIGILIQMTALVYVFPSSLGYGVSIRVANELGAGRPEKAKRAAIMGTLSGFLLGLFAVTFNISARRWWGPMFTDNAGVLELVSSALPIVGLCELGNCPQTVMCGVLRGSARAEISARLNLVGFYGVGLPVALWFGFWMGFGFVGLWVGLLAAQLWCVLGLGVVVLRTDWALQAKRAEELTSLGEVCGEDGDESKGENEGRVIVLVDP